MCGHLPQLQTQCIRSFSHNDDDTLCCCCNCYCHHINHDPSDNRVENLQWVTPEENSNAHVEWHGKKYRVSMDKESATELLGKIAETVQRIEKECFDG